MENINTLFIDIQNGNIDNVKSFFKTRDINTTDNFNRTAIINAALYNQTAIIKWLLEQGADINLQDKNGYTALHFSAQEGNIDSTMLLLENKANPNIKDIHGNTPAWVAIMNWKAGANFDTLDQLVKKGTDLTIKNCANRSALDLIPEPIKQKLKI
ncbi:Ankyrin repeat-containing protein [Flavobacterium sp. CF108]|jgi:ankyrin repeat protein|uniref:ankyrin repeat domain-containing protein n=1 Tax=unclassified Flavobacterium TaxID=196869 RepID=UPI0008B33378|nr:MULTISPECIES: ankyrin repeat domain-containing protein [unclassified Flavobacterium]SEP23172.1 Ankyrin repeat-containing protein [Flavobacterium sp. fv08]SHI00551.1 Ankyrin repeat-containing protein [Flavobacterium sp. CF108]